MINTTNTNTQTDYTTLELKEDGLLIYGSWWQEIEDLIADGDTDKAFELLVALGRYNFYGEEYSGSIAEVRRLLKSKILQIDKQRERYHKASKGGSSNSKITDEELIEAVLSQKYSTKAEIARTYGITGQAVGQRMKKLGLHFGDTEYKDEIQRLYDALPDNC